MPDDNVNVLPDEEKSRRKELLTFLFLVVALAPMASSALIGGYGLLVWLLE